MDDDYIDDDVGDVRPWAVRPFYVEGSRPVDRLPTMGQQLADAWRAENGDEPYPT